MSKAFPITDANRRWWIASGTGVSLALLLGDDIMVGVALPTIRDDLGLSQLTAQWVVNAYALTLTIFVAAGGRLGDLVGHRRMFLIAIGITVVGSLGAGLAESGPWILAARGVMGIGAAILYPLGFAMTGIAFSNRERGMGIAVAATISGVLTSTAPFVGGLLTDVASWRWIFFLNVPMLIAIGLLITAAWREQPDFRSSRSSFDAPGLAVLIVFLVPLVVALMQAPDWGWGSPAVLLLLALSAFALAAFIWTERRVAEPLLELSQLKRPTVVGANLAIFSSQFSKIGVLVFGSLFLQDRLGLSPLAAGTAMLAAVAPWLLTNLLSGWMTDRFGPRLPTLIGVAALLGSLAWLAVAVTAESYVALVPGLIVWGLSLPLVFNPPLTAILNSVPASQRGEASGVATTGRQLGGALAVAVLGASFVANGSYAAVFWIATVVSVGIWLAAYALIDRPGRATSAGRPIGAESSP